jgi:hypothetical protein
MPSRLGVGAALALSASVALLAAAPAAYAASGTPHVSQTNWFWQQQQSDIGGSGVAPPAPAPDPTVPTGDLAVAGPTTKQGADKESYVEFDLSAIPAGATLSSFTITIPLDQKARQGFVPGPLPPVVACAVTTSWVGGTGAASFSGKPADDCSQPIPGTPATGGKAYSFSITSIAQRWLGPDGINTGVALTDDPTNKTKAYQVVLGPTSAIKATAEWTAPVSTPTQSQPPPAQTNDTSGHSSTTTSISSSDSGGTGASGGAVLPPPQVIDPGGAPAPQVVPDPQLPVLTVPFVPRNASSTPPTMFWVAACVLAAIVGAAGLVLRDPVVTVPGGARRGVGRALLRRTAGRGSALIVPRSST